MRSDVTVLAGVIDPVNRPIPPFSDLAVEYLDALSRCIRAAAANIPTDIAAFGFWCRRGHVLQLKRQHTLDAVRLGHGLLFHVAPSNVPTMFAYSYAIGLLAGNSAIVRVSQRSGPAAYQLCSLIHSVLEQDTFAEIRRMTSIISYERSDEITASYMAQCDGRVIWGGNDTITKMRRFTISPYAVEAVFSDRWSAALLSQKEFSEMDDGTLSSWAHRFYNDTYIMDQRGCSCPQMVLWLCDGGTVSARQRFWACLAEKAEANYDIDAYRAVRKLEQVCLATMEDEYVQNVRSYGGNTLHVLQLSAVPPELTKRKGGFGLFYEAEINCFDELTSVVNPQIQTISCGGIDRAALAAHIRENNIRGIERIIPLGQALEMNTIWDGKDLIALLSREIAL